MRKTARPAERPPKARKYVKPKLKRHGSLSPVAVAHKTYY